MILKVYVAQNFYIYIKINKIYTVCVKNVSEQWRHDVADLSTARRRGDAVTSSRCRRHHAADV